jgi:hypothetical protein
MLNTLSSKEMKAKAAYGIAKNLMKVEQEIKSIQKAQEKVHQDPKVIEFEHKRIELCKTFSNKDEAGNAKTIGQRYDIPAENILAFEAEVQKLRDGEYKEVMEQKDKNETEWMELMKEEIDIEIHEISLNFLPDSITPQQIRILGDIVQDN